MSDFWQQGDISIKARRRVILVVWRGGATQMGCQDCCQKASVIYGQTLRARARINSQFLAPSCAPDLTDTIERNRRSSSATLRILRLSSRRRRRADGMRKWEVIFARALSNSFWSRETPSRWRGCLCGPIVHVCPRVSTYVSHHRCISCVTFAA